MILPDDQPCPYSDSMGEISLLEICRYFRLDEKDSFFEGKDHRLSEARGMTSWLVLELGVGTLGELSGRVGKDVKTLSAGVRRLQNCSKRDLQLADVSHEVITEDRFINSNIASLTPSPFDPKSIFSLLRHLPR